MKLKLQASKPLPGNIVNKIAVLKRHKNGRLVNSGKYLVTVDNMSKPILTNLKGWSGLVVSEEMRLSMLADASKGLKPIPKGTLM